jgi:hemoglobin/transferrin/lactoferrin receptor protein
MPTVDVRGTRRAVEPSANASTLRLNRSQLVRFLPGTPADAIASAPGVEMIRMGPWASKVSVRGLSGERVLLMVDGVRLNTGRGHGTQASIVSVDRLDQVELSPGAGGAEYGSDAMGGVVNLVTHRPLFSERRSLTLSLSARGSDPGGEFAQTSRLRWRSRSWGGEISGGTGRLEALVTPVGTIENSGSREDDFGARAAMRLGSGHLDAEYTRHAARDIGLPAFNNAAGATGNYPLQSREATRLELATPDAVVGPVPLRGRLLAVDQRYRSDFDESTVDSMFGGLNKIFRGLTIKHAADRIGTRSRGLQPELRFGHDGALRVSGELRREITSGPRIVDTLVTLANGSPDPRNPGGTLVTETVPNAWRDVRAAAVSAATEFGALRLQAGARYDWMRSRATPLAGSFTTILDVTDRRASWDGGVAYRADGVESYARVATGFRAPNLEERYFNGFIHGGLRVFGDPELVAERSTTFETGVRGNFDGWGSFRLSAYRSSVDDYITFKYIGMLYKIPRFQYSNVHRARIEGVELAGRARRRGVSLGVTATVPRGRDLDANERLDDVGASRLTLDIGLPAHRVVPQGIVALRARWSDAIRSDPARPATAEGNFARDAFWTLSAELGMTLGGARATFAVRNLLDHHYREPISFIDEPGRTFSFALKRDFELPVFDTQRRSVK